MIFYFSGTGNTRWAAIRLASATQERLIDIAEEMRRIKTSGVDKTEPFILKEGERLGFVFPVHGWRVPRLVRDFLSQLVVTQPTEDLTSADSSARKNPHQAPFTYAVCTVDHCHVNRLEAERRIRVAAVVLDLDIVVEFKDDAVCTAGDSIGLTIENLNATLAANDSLNALGIHEVSSAYSLIMPESYVGLPFMDVDPKEKEIRKKEKSAQELEVICEEVFNRKESINRLVKGFWPWGMTKIIGGFFEHVLITDKRFHITQEKCVKCGICANVCPVGDIKGGKGKTPEWLHHKDCLTCFCCYHHCPHHAIEFGHQTQKKGQYYYK